MILEKYKNKITNLYIFGIVVFAFSRIYQYSMLFGVDGKIESILRIVTLCLTAPKLLVEKYKKEEIAIYLMFALVFLCIVLGGDKSLILIPIILVGLKNTDIKKVVGAIFVVTLSAVIIHLLAYIYVYCSSGNSFLSMFHFKVIGLKCTVMYGDNNIYAAIFTCGLMQYTYLTNRNKNRYIKLAVLFALSVFVFSISQSRGSFIICVLVLLFYILEKNNLFVKRIELIKYITIIFSILCSAFFSICTRFDNVIFNKITSTLSGRPTIFNKAINYIGINLLPSVYKFDHINSYFGSYSMPDNSYVSTLLIWGVIVTLLICAFAYYFCFVNKNDLITNYLIIVVSIWFISEHMSIEWISYIVPLLCVSNYFNNNKIEANKP